MPRPVELPNLRAMEVHFSPDVERQLTDRAAQSGRATDDVLQDALAGYFDELVQIRKLLNDRYHEFKSGRRKAISGEDVETRFHSQSADARRPR